MCRAAMERGESSVGSVEVFIIHGVYSFFLPFGQVSAVNLDLLRTGPSFIYVNTIALLQVKPQSTSYALLVDA